jgi:hypothetical protein
LRGTVSAAASATRSRLPKYVARGGIENTAKWHTENIDLAALYKRLWPKDEHSKVQIMYAGFASIGSAQSTNAAFADFILAK